jgi:DNA-binding transcriptional regulator YhcF (GntR family)
MYETRTPPEKLHLTVRELATRWNCAPQTIKRRYREWGLRPVLITRALQFPRAQVEELEARSMRSSAATAD